MALREFPPSKSCRLQLGDGKGRYSGVWTVFSAKRAPDFYIVPRFLGGAVKVSLHASGSWQVGYTKAHCLGIETVDSRHWEIWNRGPEMAEGIVRGWYLLIPDNELRRCEPDAKAHPLPPVGVDGAVSLEVLLMANSGPTPIFDSVHLVDRWPLTGANESCVVLARRISWTDGLQSWIDALRADAAAQAVATGVVLDEDHRFYFHGHDEAGVRFGVEAAGCGVT